MHNQTEQVMIKMSQHERVYIVTYIARKLKEHALLSFIYAQNETVFLSIDMTISCENKTHELRFVSFTSLMHSTVDDIQSAKVNTLTHDSKSRLYHL